ncbi:hypothetical protein BDN72DRAFT_420401 [Pluteus cervinus]|uniref:Uncharacterized protein n=1 Tax=Pluteus cervinus TaxID=181527 RepID=A0ACD3A8Z2_9AGAR|nr:hypothetical protein BDN72DRAFT_420401 [Pluteus cervinus]
MWFGDVCYLFVKEGVYEYDPNLRYPWTQRLWVLVDSDDCPDRLPVWLSGHGNYFPVYAASPSDKRWGRFHKTISTAVLVMDPWTKPEIHAAASAVSADYDSAKLDYVYDTFGPIPRLCIDYQRSDGIELKRYARDLANSITSLDIKTLQDVVKNADDMSMDSVSQKICLIRRDTPNIWEYSFTTSPITESVASRLALQLRNTDLKDTLKIFKHYSRISSIRGMTRCIFEAICHRHFQVSIDITYTKMVRKPLNPRAKRQPQWHSAYIPLENEALEQMRLQLAQDPNGKESLKVQPSMVLEYSFESFPTHPTQDVYYIPTRSNEEALYSFIIHNNTLYIFQFTMAGNHSIKAGLALLLEKLKTIITDYRFIFVMPTDSELLQIRSPKDKELKQLQPYSARVDMNFEDLA